jgi:hypothetical protein
MDCNVADYLRVLVVFECILILFWQQLDDFKRFFRNLNLS